MPAANTADVDYDEAERQKLPLVTKVLYHIIAFFAHWFGSDHFDIDGDGDFDEMDVQSWLAEIGVLHESKKRPEHRRGKNEKPKKPKQESEGMQNPLVATTSVKAEEDEAIKNLESGKVFPYFIIGECILCGSLWVIGALYRPGVFFQTKAGLESFAPGMTDLRVSNPDCEDFRPQVWRWLTYQWSHVGVTHIMMNCFLNLLLGIPLEAAQGSLRMAAMFNLGVVGGSFNYFLFDSHIPVVGCSGGCYSLFGIHLADLAMNWNQKKFRYPTLILLVAVVLTDVLSYLMAPSEGNHSGSAHVGGALFGLVSGVLIVRNLKMHAYEKVFMGLAAAAGVLFALTSIVFLFAQDEGPRNVTEAAAGVPGWCWYRQAWNASWGVSEYQCIRCGTKECIKNFNSTVDQIAEVALKKVCFKKGWYME